jgi:hypothetical protein
VRRLTNHQAGERPDRWPRVAQQDRPSHLVLVSGSFRGNPPRRRTFERFQSSDSDAACDRSDHRCASSADRPKSVRLESLLPPPNRVLDLAAATTRLESKGPNLDFRNSERPNMDFDNWRHLRNRAPFFARFQESTSRLYQQKQPRCGFSIEVNHGSHLGRRSSARRSSDSSEDYACD